MQIPKVLLRETNLDALKLLLARRSSSVVHLSSSFNVTTFVSSSITIGEDHLVKIVHHALSSIDFMNAFTLTFQYA